MKISRFLAPLFFFIGFVSLLFTLYYGIHSLSLILASKNSVLFYVLNIVLLFFELLIAVYGIFLIIHIGYLFIPEIIPSMDHNITNLPLVTILIPTYNPDLYAVETNLLHLTNLSYKNIEIIISDNSSDPALIKEMRAICDHFQVTFLHREGITGFKAGNINNALTNLHGSYFFIIDIDQSLKPKAIKNMVVSFENAKNDKLAFIQGRFEIENANNIIRNSIAILYTFFFFVISLAKSKRGTVLFSGSSACFKTDIIKKIGGFPENSYTEDIALSYKLLHQGFTSKYLNITVTTALVSWRLQDLLTSFWRWSYGGTSVLRNYGKSIFKSKELSLDKKIELFLNGISFIALSGILIDTFLLALMHLTNVELVRGNFEFIPLIVVVPTLISISILLSCIIGLFKSKTLYRIPYLIPYSLASVAISFFILLPTFYALIGIKGVMTKNSRWNREFHTGKVILGLLTLFLIFSLIMIQKLAVNDWLWVSYAFICIIILLTIAFLIKDTKLSIEKENYYYFSNFRKRHQLTLKSKYRISSNQ